jgi:hypothetical protein
MTRNRPLSLLQYHKNAALRTRASAVGPDAGGWGRRARG